MGAEFTFYDYINQHGENEVKTWLDGAAERGKANLTARLQLLEAWPIEKWGWPYARRTLHGKCRGLFEVRAKSKGNIQWRLLGFFGPGPGEATLVFGAREVGGRFKPITTCNQAQKRKSYVVDNLATSRREHDYG